MYRVVCPKGHAFLRLAPADGEVACPRCGERFIPVEEELVDPEDE